MKDNGEIVGVDKDAVAQIKKDFVTAINNPMKIAPAFYTNIEEYIINGRIVLYIAIPNSSQVHRLNGRIYDRNEDADIDITDNTSVVTDLYNRKNNIYTEIRIFPHPSVDDLDKNLIAKVRMMAHNQKGGATHLWDTLNDLDLLKSANLYAKDPNTGQEGLNLAGILLLGSEQLITSALPHYKTDAIVRIKDLDRYDDRDVIRVNLVDSFDRLMAFVEKHLNDTFYLEGDQRISIRNKIFREVCSNLLIHREFSNAIPAKLIVEVDCVRTENANRPHGFGEIDANNFSPYPKNPVISKFFREIGLADELGSGIKNISKYLKVYSGSSPKFIEDNVFKLIIPITEKVLPQHKKPSTPTDTPTDKMQLLIDFCKTPRSRNEMQRFLDIKDKNHLLYKYIQPLVQSGQLRLTTPDKPNSKNQKYVSGEK